MTRALDLLCTGDLHLGRHPSRVPAELDGPELSPKSVWLSIVQTAIDRNSDAVVITGDVVDRENKYFEAYGAFEDGLAQLDNHDIPVVAVAGNHDHDVLPEMAENLAVESLHVLGEGGEWERLTIERDGRVLAHVDGWSFPAEHVYESPLDEYDLPEADGVPQIGVVHADLDVSESRYAPVQASELRTTSPDPWLFGHIHTPGVQIDARPLVLYPGSPQPLDPGEQQRHGPWVVEIAESGDVRAEQVPLATVRYDTLTVDVSDAGAPQAVTAELSDALREHVRTELETAAVEVCLVRVRLTGRTEAHAALVDQHRSMERDLGFREGAVSVRVESIAVETKPALDLQSIATGETAAANLAQLLLDIENGSVREERSELIDESLAALRRADSANAYNPLRREAGIETPEEADAIEQLETQARLLLETLLDQKEGQA